MTRFFLDGLVTQRLLRFDMLAASMSGVHIGSQLLAMMQEFELSGDCLIAVMHDRVSANNVVCDGLVYATISVSKNNMYSKTGDA